jgi:hypothetical protein
MQNVLSGGGMSEYVFLYGRAVYPLFLSDPDVKKVESLKGCAYNNLLNFLLP